MNIGMGLRSDYHQHLLEQLANVMTCAKIGEAETDKARLLITGEHMKSFTYEIFLGKQQGNWDNNIAPRWWLNDANRVAGEKGMSLVEMALQCRNRGIRFYIQPVREVPAFRDDIADLATWQLLFAKEAREMCGDDVGIIGGPFSVGTISDASMEKFEPFLATCRDVDGNRLGLDEYGAAGLPWAWMGQNQSEQITDASTWQEKLDAINLIPYPSIYEPDQILPAYLFLRYLMVPRLHDVYVAYQELGPSDYVGDTRLPGKRSGDTIDAMYTAGDVYSDAYFKASSTDALLLTLSEWQLDVLSTITMPNDDSQVTDVHLAFFGNDNRRWWDFDYGRMGEKLVPFFRGYIDATDIVLPPARVYSYPYFGGPEPPPEPTPPDDNLEFIDRVRDLADIASGDIVMARESLELAEVALDALRDYLDEQET